MVKAGSSCATASLSASAQPDTADPCSRVRFRIAKQMLTSWAPGDERNSCQLWCCLPAAIALCGYLRSWAISAAVRMQAAIVSIYHDGRLPDTCVYLRHAVQLSSQRSTAARLHRFEMPLRDGDLRKSCIPSGERLTQVWGIGSYGSPCLTDTGSASVSV